MTHQAMGRPCRKCEADDWYLNRVGKNAHCRPCTLKYHHGRYSKNLLRNREYAREYQRKLFTDPARRAKRAAYDSQQWQGRRWEIYKREYGLTMDQFHAMFEAQGELCKLCGDVLGISPHLDHDHKTKRIRGLLCGHCNKALGLFRDNPEVLRRAAAYVGTQ